MGFQISPGVNVTEIDLTTIVPAVSTTAGGMAGVFRWGPCHERTLVDSENLLKQTFGEPNSDSYPAFFTAANFLGYGNNLQVVRVVDTAVAKNASTGADADGVILNEEDYELNGATVFNDADDCFIGKYPGTLGNSLRVICLDASPTTGNKGFTAMELASSVKDSVGATGNVGDTHVVIACGDGGVATGDFFAATGDIIDWYNGERSILKYAVSNIGGSHPTTGATLQVELEAPLSIQLPQGSTGTLLSKWTQYFSTFPSTTQSVEDAGGTADELHVLVIDEDGKWTGQKERVLETYEGLSKAADATRLSGENIYYKNVINRDSKYIWVGPLSGAHISDAHATADKTDTFTDMQASDAWGGAGTGLKAGIYQKSLAGGVDGSFSQNMAKLYTHGYVEFEDAETVDVSLILGGVANATVQQLIIDLCDKRKDCIAFLSPVGTEGTEHDIVANKSVGNATRDVRNFRNITLNKSSSYAVMDSGYKYQYDRYNDVYRYIALNGDIAGLCARTEQEFEAWFSPGGFNRGQIRGVVKLGLNPRQAHRDNLYKDQINPVVAFPGEGTILYGDKTLQSKPSAFDRINVRRLFIILEKAIATAAKFSLFEFNDAFTRNQFRNMVVPFLRDVQARRGIFDFKVVCDDSNNPGSVIDRNEFVADIFIKPARSINFIQLNFIATATGVDFSEVGG
tara:strand:- start:25099 stop:27150 length:2052 start_codon:yes stop_codon:yes gene_type:complete